MSFSPFLDAASFAILDEDEDEEDEDEDSVDCVSSPLSLPPSESSWACAWLDLTSFDGPTDEGDVVIEADCGVVVAVFVVDVDVDDVVDVDVDFDGELCNS